MGELSSAIRLFFSFGLGAKKKGTLEDIAQYSLQHNMSYRLDASASIDRWIGLREWYRHVIKTNGSGEFFQRTEKTDSAAHALITWDFYKDPKALLYVQQFHAQPVSHFVGKDLISLNHIHANFMEKMLLHLFSLLVS